MKSSWYTASAFYLRVNESLFGLRRPKITEEHDNNVTDEARQRVQVIMNHGGSELTLTSLTIT